MATSDEYLRRLIGDLVIQIALLQAEVERLKLATPPNPGN